MAQPCWLRLGMVWRWLLNKFVLGVEGQGRSRGEASVGAPGAECPSAEAILSYLAEKRLLSLPDGVVGLT